MAADVLQTVRAFLGTAAVRDALNMPPAYVATLGRVLQRDGLIKGTDPAQQRIEATIWLLELAAQHGLGWREVAVRQILKGQRKDPEIEKYLAESRSRALALVEVGEFSNAVESLMRSLMANPKTTMPSPVEIILRMKGLEAALLGREAMRRWVEVFL